MRIVKLIDKISQWTGALSAWIVIPLMVVVIIDVFQRHVLNNPTHWGYDVLWMLFSAQFLLGGAFTMLRNGHIRIDIVYGLLSDRAKRIRTVAGGRISPEIPDRCHKTTPVTKNLQTPWGAWRHGLVRLVHSRSPINPG